MAQKRRIPYPPQPTEKPLTLGTLGLASQVIRNINDLLLAFKWQIWIYFDAVIETEGAVGGKHQGLLTRVDPEHQAHLRTVSALDNCRLVTCLFWV